MKIERVCEEVLRDSTTAGAKRMKLSRKIQRRRERELAKRRRRIHAHSNEDGLHVIERYLVTTQDAYRALRTVESYREFSQVKDTLTVLERMHREVMRRTRCDDCLAEFKRKKFYVLDEAGFEYSAEGLVDRRTAIAS